MRLRPKHSKSEHAIALVIVMIAILVLAVLAGAFAYSMKVETTLARNANNEVELEWLGRSGVEYARWILMTQRTCPAEQYDALSQVWAGGSGGPCTTNTALGEVLQQVPLENGYFTWKITDLERKFNINTANEAILQQAMILMGADAGEFPGVVGSILDWIDTDDNPHIEGSENEYYHTLQPPYDAKNGPIDDLSEMLMINGVTLDMFWGSGSTNHPAAGHFFQQQQQQQRRRFGGDSGPPMYAVGLVDLFTPLSNGKLNINTASAYALQLIPGVDANIAEAIVSSRSGEDDGSGLTGPFRSVQGLWQRVPGLPPELARQVQQFCDVRSSTFEVQIDAYIGSSHRKFVAILGRSPNPRDIQVLNFYWKFDQ